MIDLPTPNLWTVYIYSRLNTTKKLDNIIILDNIYVINILLMIKKDLKWISESFSETKKVSIGQTNSLKWTGPNATYENEAILGQHILFNLFGYKVIYAMQTKSIAKHFVMICWHLLEIHFL